MLNVGPALIASSTGDWDTYALYKESVGHVASALQLFDDLSDIEEDKSLGQMNFFSCRDVQAPTLREKIMCASKHASRLLRLAIEGVDRIAAPDHISHLTALLTRYDAALSRFDTWNNSIGQVLELLGDEAAATTDACFPDTGDSSLEWTPFVKVTESIPAPDGLGHFNEFRNSRYCAFVRHCKTRSEAFRTLKHIAFRRIDYQSTIPWRDKQRLKNELLGEHWDCVELCPSEARLVDNSNMYHLWCLPPGTLWPVGWFTRVVSKGDSQEPWSDGTEPPDIRAFSTVEEMMQCAAENSFG